jgi:ATP/maltotriose-dependent transcriptional regulator MalT
LIKHLASSSKNPRQCGSGAVTTLQNWLAALPVGIRRGSPQLCLAQAWGALAVGQFTMVDSSILEADKAIGSLAEADAKPLRAEVDAIRSALAGYRQDSTKAIELAYQALEHLPEGDHFLRGHLAYNLGWAYLSRGDLPAASQKLREAATFSLWRDLFIASFAPNALHRVVRKAICEAASCYRRLFKQSQRMGGPGRCGGRRLRQVGKNSV